jgi:hypothetical protein
MRLIAAVFIGLAFAAPALADKPKLDMVAFFSGRSEADNILRVVFKAATSLNVESIGKMEGNQFVLIDTVHEGTKPARQRKWVTHQVGPGHYTGTLSDAEGPVDITVAGDTANVRYKMKGGLDVVQTMVLNADGKSLSNHVAVHKFGLRFARVDGTIRKLD